MRLHNRPITSHRNNLSQDNLDTSNPPPAEQAAATSQLILGTHRSTADLMSRILIPFNRLTFRKKFGPLPFRKQLESDMREAGCSSKLIARFNKQLGEPDPQSMYAQNILADLQAHGFSPECVQRHCDRMHDFWAWVNQWHQQSGRATTSKRWLLIFWTDRLSLGDRQLTAVPPEIAQLHRLWELDLSTNELTSLPPEFWQLHQLAKLYLHSNRFATLPPQIGQLCNLRWLDLSSNQLTSLPDEIGELRYLLHHLNLSNNQLTDLPETIGSMRNLRTLNLRNNRFTHVPRALLDLPASFEIKEIVGCPFPEEISRIVQAEIDLQDNPLPAEEIAAVREEIARRRAAGQEVPQFILPVVQEGNARQRNTDQDNALRLAAQNELNVHTHSLTDAFKRLLDDLTRQFPNALNGTIDQQREEMRNIHSRLIAAIDRYEKRHPHPDSRVARQVAQRMFEKGYGERAARYNEFRYSSGHVLSYVILAIEAQWARTPEAHRAEAQQNGVKQLVDFLAAGGDFCDTRQIEEVLQLIGLPLSQYAHDHPEIVNPAVVLLSAQNVRDTAFPVAQRILRELVQGPPKLSDRDLVEAFRTTLARTMHAEHPAISADQLNKYLDKDILSEWETFKELTLEEPAAASGSSST